MPGDTVDDNVGGDVGRIAFGKRDENTFEGADKKRKQVVAGKEDEAPPDHRQPESPLEFAQDEEAIEQGF